MLIFNYITTNLITGKQYIGMHCAKSLNDKYYGSGVLILKAFKKYGKENFTREILAYCDTVDQAHKNEKVFIEKYNTIHPNGYNLSPTGGLGSKGCHSKEAKMKMMGNKNAQGTIPSEETREKIRRTKIGNTWGFQKGHTLNVNKKHSEETKKKMSLAKTGNKWKLSEETKKHLSELRKGRDVSWLKGKPRSEEVKRKISETKKLNPYWKGKKHTPETIEKMRESAIRRKKVA